jgi:hypothetical protein
MGDRRYPRLAGLISWPGIAAYAWLAWELCHDGTSPAEFGGLLIAGVILLVMVCAIDWILAGPGQLDREDGGR